MEKKKGNVTPINPTLNGGEHKDDLLQCGCDPANAELDEQGKRRVFLVKQNANFFVPLGASMGMQITLCAQCKEVMGFQVMSPAIAQPAPPSIVLS